MSRTLHVSLSEGEVTESCRKHAVAISAIEPLVSGGTRLVVELSPQAWCTTGPA